MRFSVTTLAIALLAPLVANAQPAAETPPAETLPHEMAPPAAPGDKPVVAEPEASGPALTMDAMVDAYYMYNITGDPTRQGPAAPPRVFDMQANSFTLNYVKLGGGIDTERAGFRFDIGFGQMASALNSTVGNAAFVQQAYATLKFGGVTVDGGKFTTTAGAEVIEAYKNANYSRSILFGLVPFLHTGVRVNIPVSDMLTLQGSLVNGYDNDIDNNGDKTFGASVALTPMEGTTVVGTTYIGKEATTDTRLLVDLVVAHQISSTLGLNLNVDFRKEGDSNAVGGSLVAKLAATEALNLAFRGEFVKFDDADGTILSGFEGNIFEGTVTAGIPFGSNMEARAEVRGDFSDKEIFTKGTEAKKNQFTALVAFLAFLP